jgi:amino acid transporter
MAFLKVLSTYQGWSTAAYVLNEVKDPVRTLSIAGTLALSTVGILYTFTNIAYFAVATPKEISESGVTVAAFFMGKVFGDSARRAAAIFAALSALGNMMSVSFSLSRVDQELAKEGILPFSSFLARNSYYGTPAATLGLVFLTTSLTVTTIPFGDYPQSSSF